MVNINNVNVYDDGEYDDDDDDDNDGSGKKEICKEFNATESLLEERKSSIFWPFDRYRRQILNAN